MIWFTIFWKRSEILLALPHNFREASGSFLIGEHWNGSIWVTLNSCELRAFAIPTPWRNKNAWDSVTLWGGGGWVDEMLSLDQCFPIVFVLLELTCSYGGEVGVPGAAGCRVLITWSIAGFEAWMSTSLSEVARWTCWKSWICWKSCFINSNMWDSLEKMP